MRLGWTALYQNMHFKKKVMLLLGLGSALTLTLTLILAMLMLFVYFLFQKTAFHNLTTHADLISQNSTAPLTFSDQEAGRETLASLKEVPDIVEAVLYDGEGRLFASYLKMGADAKPLPELLPQEGPDVFQAAGELLLAKSITFEGSRIGRLYLRFSMARINGILAWQAMVAVSSGIFVLLVVLGISSRLLNPLMRPVLELTETAEKVSKTKDYTLRARQYTSDDLGLLTDTFNAMLNNIQERDKALKHAQEVLETRVRERTRDLEQASLELAQSSRLAGMADVATSILHNVGNILNSINISISVVNDRLNASRINNLSRAINMLLENKDGLDGFLTTDEKGKLLPDYLAKATAILVEDNQFLSAEVVKLRDNIDHVKEIVSMQQNYATTKGTIERVSVEDILSAALQVHEISLKRHEIAINVECDGRLTLLTDKHKVLQILVNLISNAKHAMKKGQSERRVLTIKVAKESPDHLTIAVMDNGIGISAENKRKIFQYGFTTKKTGHGFGLHASANSAKEMQGGLMAESAGLGQGATFTLRLPLNILDKTGKQGSSRIAKVGQNG